MNLLVTALVSAGPLLSTLGGLLLALWPVETAKSKGKARRRTELLKLLCFRQSLSHSAALYLIALGSLSSFSGGMLSIREQNTASRRLEALTTGGDSFCYLHPGIVGPTTGIWRRLIAHSGTYPMHDVELMITDRDKIEAVIRDQSQLSRLTPLVTWKVGEVSPGANHPLKRFLSQPLYPDRVRYEILIGARNGRFLENLSLRRINGQWKRALRVTSRDQKRLFLEEIDPTFSRDPKGSPDWQLLPAVLFVAQYTRDPAPEPAILALPARRKMDDYLAGQFRGLRSERCTGHFLLLTLP